MPIAAAVGDIWQLRVQGRQEGQQTNNIIHFHCTSASEDVLTHLVQVFADCFIDNLLPVLSSSWSLEGFGYRRMSAPATAEQFFIPTGTLAGAGNAAALPSFASLCISIQSLSAGRSNRGRFYIAGIPETATTNSQFDTSAAFWIAAVAFCACLASNFFHPDGGVGEDEFDIGVYSRKEGGAVIPYNPAGFEPAAALVPRQVVATMRSRKLGVGV